jgi:hypothetical protein
MTFLPDKYQIPDTGAKYMKFKKGDNRFRILSSPILGYEWWVETEEGRKPKRVPMDAQISPDELDPSEDPPKHFWAMVVFDYDDEKVKVLEITQKSIMRNLRGLSEDEDWGDPKGDGGYDIVVERTGEGFETRYSVKPKPRKKLKSGVMQMYEDMNIKLEALYKGDDPFAGGSEELAGEAAKVLG